MDQVHSDAPDIREDDVVISLDIAILHLFLDSGYGTSRGIMR